MARYIAPLALARLLLFYPCWLCQCNVHLRETRLTRCQAQGREDAQRTEYQAAPAFVFILFCCADVLLTENWNIPHRVQNQKTKRINRFGGFPPHPILCFRWSPGTG